MKRCRESRQTGPQIHLTLAALFSPQLAMWAAVIRILRGQGWRFALVTFSVLGNLLFVVVVILAYSAASHSGAGACSDTVYGVFPSGMRCRGPGPLYFAEFSPGTIPDSVLPPTIYVVMDGCILAGFEFDAQLRTVNASQLNDDMCRSRVDLTLATGAFIYTNYGKGFEAEYSLRDEDGDGVPDRKVDWITNESFIRSHPLEWELIRKSGSVDGG